MINVVTTVDAVVLVIEGPTNDSSIGICASVASDDFSLSCLPGPGEVGCTGVTTFLI